MKYMQTHSCWVAALSIGEQSHHAPRQLECHDVGGCILVRSDTSCHIEHLIMQCWGEMGKIVMNCLFLCRQH